MMLERLCERVREAWAERWATDKEEFDLDLFEPIVRAVLMELREIDPDALSVAATKIHSFGNKWEDSTKRTSDAWQAMIDSILEERE